MQILLLLILLTALTLPWRTRIFEAILWSLGTTPIFAYLLHDIGGMSALGYGAVLILNITLWSYYSRHQFSNRMAEQRSEIIAIMLLICSFIGIYLLTLQWDQFFPMGERLRDYALLSSVLRSPYELHDPWLSGYGLNYYAYWYRFGHFLSSITGLEAPQLYMQLPALTCALFITTLARLANRFLGWSIVSSSFAAIIIALGSNFEGIVAALKHSHDWWAPSRVIPGAIHEFPVWSLLLGDLHPHFLNLVGIPALTLLFLDRCYWNNSPKPIVDRLLISLQFMLGGALLTFNANAWEVPIWGLLCGGLTLSFIIAERETVLSFAKLGAQTKALLRHPQNGVGIILTILLITSLYWSSRNILSNPYPVSWVEPPIARTTALEFARHWGVPLALGTLALILGTRALIGGGLILAALIGTLYAQTIVPTLTISLVGLVGYFLRELFVKKTDLLPSQILLNSLAIASVILVLIPEFIFLNDPYGGENERMNTIFKIYSSCWALMHLAAFGLFREQIIRYSAISGFSPYYYFPAFVALMLAFLWEIAPVRASKPQSSVAAYGSLAVAEDTFPGSAAAILYLRAQPGGVVLEAQGNAYDWTSFVATLSDKDSFLGWANHVNLLIREYGEIARREAITKEFYTDPSCARRREILEQEKIRFAVVGILEEKQYSGSGARDYSCLTLAYQRGQYRVFRTQ